MFATFKYFQKNIKNWKNFIWKIQKNRTLLALTIENSVLKKDKKTNIIFWERHKSLFLFLWNDDMSCLFPIVFGNLYEIFKIARYAIRKIKERT